MAINYDAAIPELMVDDGAYLIFNAIVGDNTQHTFGVEHGNDASTNTYHSPAYPGVPIVLYKLLGVTG
jgi:hypothetical protein